MSTLTKGNRDREMNSGADKKSSVTNTGQIKDLNAEVSWKQ